MQQYVCSEKKFLQHLDYMQLERNILCLKIIQDHIDPTRFCRNSSIFCLGSAIDQKFHRFHFLINLFKNVDRDSKIIMDFRKNRQNIPEELVLSQNAIRKFFNKK